MSKVLMKRIFICGPRTQRKNILELLQRMGTVEINSDDIRDKAFSTMDVETQRSTFLRAAKQSEEALAILKEYAPDKSEGLLSSLEDARSIEKASYDGQLAHVGDYLETASKIVSINKQIIEDKTAIPKCRTDMESLSAWKDLDIPLDFIGTSKSRVFIGSISEEASASQIYEKLSAAVEDKDIPDIDVDIISTDKTMTAFMVICHADDAAKVENALKQIDFQRAPSSKSVPKEEIKALNDRISNYEADIKKCIDQIAGYAGERENIKFASDYYSMRADKYEVLGNLPQSANAFFISGFTPAASADRIAKKLEAFDAVVEITDPLPEDEVPCELKNGFLSDPMESVVESYSFPGSGEIDPSKITACFYYIMFGMMLSDAGYGLLLVLGCGFALLKVKNMKPSMKKMMKLLFFSGISTVFWGFMFGSFFGDAVHIIASTFFGRPDIALNPVWFNPQEEPMRLLVVAFLIGIIHLLTGLSVKFYELLRDGQIKDAVYDCVFWYMFVGGGIIYILTMPMITGMLGLSFTLNSTIGTISAAAMAIGGVGVVLTGGRESKNWFKRFLKGLYAAYGITGYLSDILSYSRLLALGLATGVIAQVFNQMGSMIGGSWYGAIIFLIIFVVGHTLNLGINVLGAYVHTNRLQFVEFFGKFYEGGGRKFSPFKENTKYYKVKEEI